MLKKGRGRGKRPEPQFIPGLQQTKEVQNNNNVMGNGGAHLSYEGVKKQFSALQVTPEESYRKGTGHETFEPHLAQRSQTASSAGNGDGQQRKFGATGVQPKLNGHSVQPHCSPEITRTDQPSSNDSKLQKARKPGYGTCKRRDIEIVTNFFPIANKKQDIYHYDVEIIPVYNRMYHGAQEDPPKPVKKEMCRQIIELMKIQKHLGEYFPVYDGQKNMFTAKPLPIGDGQEHQIALPVNGRDKNFCVALKPVVKKKSKNNVISSRLLEDYEAGRTVDFPEEVRLAYDAIMAHRGQHSDQMRCGMSFFVLDQMQQRYSLGDGLELLQGYNQNIRFTEKGTAVIINIATSAFHKSGPLINYVADVLRRPFNSDTFLSNQDIYKLNNTLKNVRVQVTHDTFKRKYYIFEVSRTLPRDHKFNAKIKEREVSVSVADYLQTVYKHRLKYPKLPLLIMRGGKVYLPFEVCDVMPGQRFPGRNLDGKKKAEMIKFAATPPAQKFQQIDKYAESACNISYPTMHHYGLDMQLEPIAFNTRILDQPKIEYSSSNIVTPTKEGVWEMRQRFSSAAKTNHWMILSFADPKYCNEKVLDNLACLLCKAGNKAGLQLERPTFKFFTSNDRTEDVIEKAKKIGLQFVVMVLSKKMQSYRYHEVKFFADAKFNLVSQCVEESLITGRRFNDKVAANICLKINTKLAGVNHTLSEWPLALERESVLIIGADVVHSGDLTCSSIAAVVGCVNYNMSQYAVSCRALSNPNGNGKNQEIILTLKEMIKTILLGYYRANNQRKPKKILFYRDGISEGQFQQALEIEIPLIKKACQEIEENYMPPITFVVVQKRIQARFKPKDPREGCGRMQNVPPGTIVDRHIVDPVNYDFYLVSHEGIQGTSKPVYYTVLFDENRVQPDVIQTLSFYLCYVYARCNRSISIPAPVKYADLLAYRAMHYVDAFMGKKTAGERYSSSQGSVPTKIQDLLKSIEKIQNKMFFI